MQIIIPIILAGGAGTRLWPLSRSHYPKPFIQLESSPFSLFQSTLMRCLDLQQQEVLVKPPVVVVNEQHRFIAAQQAREMSCPLTQILVEPESRNTMAAFSLAVAYCRQHFASATVILMPSDHEVSAADINRDILQLCQSVEANPKTIGLLGKTPQSPSEQFGYLKVMPTKDAPAAGASALLSVSEFVEKPSAKLAQEMLRSEQWLWNLGIYVVNAEGWCALTHAIFPTFAGKIEQLLETAQPAYDFLLFVSEQYSALEATSVDYCVTEHIPALASIGMNVCAINFSGDWQDSGNWSSYSAGWPQDEQGNRILGRHHLQQTQNCIVYSDGPLVVTAGLEDHLIVATQDCVLVSATTDLDRSVIEQMQARQLPEVAQGVKEFRPWGTFEVLADSRGYKVKKLVVNPGASISLQRHQRRSEHWVVVSGEAVLEKEGVSQRLQQNQSAYIAPGELHRLSNQQKTPVELIEVQTGEQIDEDDIERFADDYGRQQSVSE